MKFSISRQIAHATLDDIFLKKFREIVGDAIETRDAAAMNRDICALHRDREEAVRIIDNNLVE